MNDAIVAFVAGATGYTGREVVRELCERGVDTVAHVRPDSAEVESWRRRFEQLGAAVDTTRWQEQELAETLRRLSPAIVFALLGTTKKRARAEREAGKSSSYETVDYGLTAMLRRACESIPVKPRFVYLSSTGVRDASPGSYMYARYRIESELRAGTLPYTIARPSFITGPDRDDARPGERFGAAVADGALAFAGLLGARRLRERYRSTTPGILARALVRLALDPSAENRVFESEDLR